MSPAQPRLTGLWRHRDFMWLWGSQTVSQFGTQVSLLAIPLTAAVTLDASPAQMGIVTAAETAPFLLFGLIAGAIVDRVRRRPILIWTDIGRALLLAVIPIAWALDVLRIELLIAVGFLVGVLNVFFDVSYQSYLPALVERRHLVEGNSKLETSRAGAQIAGPGIAGVLIQVLTAPVAVVLDAVSFIVSGILLGFIRKEEPEPAPRSAGRSMFSEIGEGISYIGRHRLLLPIAGCTATSNFFSGMIVALLVLYLTTELDISAGLIGLIFAAGSVGFMLGALTAGRFAARFGLGTTITLAIVLSGAGLWLVPLASGPRPAAIGMLVLALFAYSAGGAIYNINQVSLRQTITPDRLLGRMNATMRFLVWGVLPLGNLAGGALGEIIGLRATLFVGVTGATLAVLWPLLSDVGRLKEHPEGFAEEQHASVPA
jgi:MFS family permease